MTDRKPVKYYMENEADLENLVVGDQVKVTLIPEISWMVYEGTIDEMKCFAEFAGGRGHSKCTEIHSWRIMKGTEIYSWRIKKENSRFGRGTIIIGLCPYKFIEYEPSSPEYQKAKELLEQAGLMERNN